ncbi:MAG: helix-turn-helix domain-containing protein [Flavobacteriaceae bacterium]|nr:helix-turn-helix domain-containing protein [Flavobacteriaceae bacterium]
MIFFEPPRSENHDLYLVPRLYPITPSNLKYPKPKHFRYPTEIITVGDEVRRMRMDRELTQREADDLTNARLIKNGYSLQYVAENIGFDKSTLGRFE